MIALLRYGATLGALLVAGSAMALDGAVRAATGASIPYAFVSLLGTDGTFLGYGITDNDGNFHIDGEGARIAIQPPGQERPDGLATYAYMPRIFNVDGIQHADTRLPACGSLVLKAYDPEGKLLRWGDFESIGRFGGQFMYYTNLLDRMSEASFWPVHDSESRAKDNPREMGLPGVMVYPGEAGAVQLLYWPVKGYGKVLLRMDNGGKGYTIAKPGDVRVIEVNVALAETALVDHALRAARYGVEQTAELTAFSERMAAVHGAASEPERAALADALLADLLRASDTLVIEASKSLGASRTAAFSFGVFQGGPYASKPYKAAREAGFDLATVLPGWAWCDLATGKTKGQIDSTLGISALSKQGYTVKAHGVVWLQSLGILPSRAEGMAPQALCDAMLSQLGGLLNMFGDRIDLWEAMNEPANVNTIGLPVNAINYLAQESAAVIHKAGKQTLVNNGHEADYGNAYSVYLLDGSTESAGKMSYLTWLDRAKESGIMKGIDVIGLQFYPGAHLGDRLGGVQGPCMTPAWFADTLQRYAAYGKPVHITECSIPSAHPAGSNAGYWGDGWTAETQADYAEKILTIAYGHRAVESFTWWDITDADASVVNGGMMMADGTPKPVFDRLGAFIATAHAAR